MHFKEVVSLAAAAALFLGLASTASAQNYTVLDLGNVTATALNDLGQVAGGIYGDGYSTQAFYTGTNGVGLTTLGIPTSRGAWAMGINNRGQVVGYYLADDFDGFQYRGFVTGAGGQGVTDVVHPDPDAYGTILKGINDSGQTAGWTESPTQMEGWDFEIQAITSGPQGAGWQALDIPSNMSSTTIAINASGQVLGIAANLESSFAFLTGPNGQGLTQVGSSLGGVQPFQGAGLNNHGDVVGQALFEEGLRTAYLVSADGTMTNLGALDDFYSSRATGINDQGMIVGSSTDFADTNSTAFIIGGPGQGMVKLSTLVVGFEGSFSEAVAINNVGQILASDGYHSYLLTPTAIPEAQTSAMLMLGFLGMGWATARHRAKPAPTTQT